MHNTTDKAARGEVSHLNAFACPSPIDESGGEWGSLPGAASLRLKPPLAGFRRRNTARGHPSNPPSRSNATPKPPLNCSHSVLKGHLSLTHCV